MDRPFTLSEGVDSWNTIIFIISYLHPICKEFSEKKRTAEAVRRKTKYKFFKSPRP